MERRVLLFRVAAITLPLVVWEGLVDARIIDPFFFGKPSLIGLHLWADIQNAAFWSHIFLTGQEALSGLALGTIIGCGLAFLFSKYRTLYRGLDPIIYSLYSLPRIALAPLFVLWFGIGPNSKVALAFSIVFFIMLLNTYTGITAIDHELVDAVRLMGASQLFIHRTVSLPAIVPWLAAGFRLSSSYALLAAITGEMVSSLGGIGRLLVDRQAFFDTNGIFALLCVVGLIATLVNSVTQRAERSFSRWRYNVTVTE